MRLLDLFCGAGGAAVGYHRAGFEVVGVDIAPQPNYPFEFVQDDALALMSTFPWWDVAPFDAVHASPPCQAYTTMNQRWGTEHPDLIGRTREALVATGLPYVIENVPGALKEMRSPVRICGFDVGLKVKRQRLFESNVVLLVPPCSHPPMEGVAVYGKLDGRRLWTRVDGSELRACKTLEEAQDAMGIDWMTWDEIREAIPPAYTELIGTQLVSEHSVERVE